MGGVNNYKMMMRQIYMMIRRKFRKIVAEKGKHKVK